MQHWRSTTCLALISLLWWVATPYIGPNHHDGLFYTAEALRRIEPLAFAGDVFFQGTTQGNFSLFGPVYGEFIRQFGLRPASLFLSLAGRLFWLLAAWCLAVQWARRSNKPVWLIWAPLLLLPTDYDSFGIFHRGEAMPTPRVWAEALVIWCLNLILANRHRWAVVPAAMAVCLHPLMALPGAVFWLCCLSRRRAMVGLSLAGLGVLILAAWGIAPFSNLFQRYDDAWWTALEVRNLYVLAHGWSGDSLVRVLLCGALCVQASRRLDDGRLRAFAAAMAATTALCVIPWVVGSALHNVLLLQLQLWRVLWLAMWLAPVMWLASQAPIREWSRLTWTQAVLLCAVIWTSNGEIAGAALVGWLLLESPAITTALGRHRNLLQVLPWLAGLLVLMALPARLISLAASIDVLQLGSAPWPVLAALCAESLVSLPLVAWAALAAADRSPSGPQAVAAQGWVGSAWVQRTGAVTGVAVALLLVVSAAHSVGVWIDRAKKPMWDLREAQALIPPGSVVFWDAGVEATWLQLRRGHYASWRQGAGLLFSRDTALTLWSRAGRLQAQGLGSDGYTLNDQNPVPPGPTPPLAQVWRALCADPALNFVITSGRHVEASAVVDLKNDARTTLSIFDCQHAQHPVPTPS